MHERATGGRKRIMVQEGAELVFPSVDRAHMDFSIRIEDRDGNNCAKKPYFSRVTKDNKIHIITK